MRFRSVIPFAIVALAALAPAGAAAQRLPRLGAQTAPADSSRAAGRDDSAAADTARMPVDSGSPRASMERFLVAARAADWTTASTYLSVPDTLRAQAPELARELKAVLDRYLWVDLEKLSPLASGNRQDGLAADLEEIGTIPVRNGNEPVRLRRVAGPAPGRWVFTRATTERIDDWYATLGWRWLLDRVPMPLQRSGPWGIQWWQWIALVAALGVAYLVAFTIRRLTTGVLVRLTARTTIEYDDLVVQRTRGPILIIWFVLVYRLLIEAIGLPDVREQAVGMLLKALFTGAFFWMLARVVGVIQTVLPNTPWAATRPGARNVVPLLARIVRVVVGLLGLVAVLGVFGYPVGTLLAGLGIGGIAVALGAQKTLEHFFGSLSIAVDQPFRVGDFVRGDQFLGTIETIGLRTTRIRTLDRSVIAVPNGRLADMSVENFGQRDRFRLATNIGLTYDTTAEQMRQVRDGFERVLREHPKIWPEGIAVRFGEFGAYSLNIEVMAWFLVPDFDAFRVAREEALLGFMKVVEEAGTGFAFPTQTVHVVAERDGRREEQRT